MTLTKDIYEKRPCNTNLEAHLAVNTFDSFSFRPLYNRATTHRFATSTPKPVNLKENVISVTFFAISSSL